MIYYSHRDDGKHHKPERKVSMKQTIWWDMDGCLCALYDYEGWLDCLINSDPTPYAEAAVMHNMSILARYMNKAQKLGYHIGIISWLSKNSTLEYDKEVIAAKKEWLHKHLNSVQFDSINIVSYGTPKEKFMKTDNDILFDDEQRNRNNWRGYAYNPSQIIEVLKRLIKEG
jgi:hypothetical protein